MRFDEDPVFRQLPFLELWNLSECETLKELAEKEQIPYETPAVKAEYKNSVDVFQDFCKAQKIRCHVKIETLKFIGES